MASIEPKLSSSSGGFSLIELVFVVIVIGILAAIAIPSLIGSRRAVDQKLAVTQLNQIGQAEDTYKRDLNIGRYATLKQLRNSTPGGNPLIDPLIMETDGTAKIYKGWIFQDIESPTTTSFGIKVTPADGNAADYSFFMYNDGVVRRTARSGPWTRNTGDLVEQ